MSMASSSVMGNSSGASAATQLPVLLEAVRHTSPLLPNPNNPMLGLASHTLRETFGSAVQLTADALESFGEPCTFRQLVQHVQSKTKTHKPRVKLGNQNSSQSQMSSAVCLRASLLVLLQHSIVQALPQPRCSSSSSEATSFGRNLKRRKGAEIVQYRYKYIPNRACWIIRYSQYIELTKKAVDLAAACVIETLLLRGRLGTIELVRAVVDRERQLREEHRGDDDDDDDNGDTGDNNVVHFLPKSDRYTDQQTTVDSLWKLVAGGWLERVPVVNHDQREDEEVEFDEPPSKKVKLEDGSHQHQSSATRHAATSALSSEDAAIQALLLGNARYKADLLPGNENVPIVWRVNINAMHAHMRAHCIGRLVGELAGHKVQSAGSLVAAALKHQAHVKFVVLAQQQQQSKNKSNQAADLASSEVFSFEPQDTVKYLPKSITQEMEKKVGGVKRSLALAWEELAKIDDPLIVRRAAETSGKYEVATSVLVRVLRERTVHQLIVDRHDQISARIVSILGKQGWLESDHLSTLAMLPSKDAREKLHYLYRNRYVELFQLTNSRTQHNTNATIYLWTVHQGRLERQIRENVAQALLNVRLRRQHQVQNTIGNTFIERAQNDDFADENENETDQLNYQRFCLGLERLDCAAIQLDITFMLLSDF